MAKRGRKPKTERKGYFYEKQEEAVMAYIKSNDQEERNRIFKTILYPAFTKMIESIIRRYKLYVPDEEFDQTFKDTISFLLTKITNFHPETYIYEEVEPPTKEMIDSAETVWYDNFILKSKFDEESPKYLKVVGCDDSDWDNPKQYTVGYYKKVKKHFKAYSYCGTICKNYLIYKINQFKKKIERNEPYDDIYEKFQNNIDYSQEDFSEKSVAEELSEKIVKKIRTMVGDTGLSLSDNEKKVGIALCELFENWEDILCPDGSNKLHKSSVLYFLREETMMSTKELRENMAVYKKEYYLLKNLIIE